MSTLYMSSRYMSVVIWLHCSLVVLVSTYLKVFLYFLENFSLSEFRELSSVESQSGVA